MIINSQNLEALLLKFDNNRTVETEIYENLLQILLDNKDFSLDELVLILRSITRRFEMHSDYIKILKLLVTMLRNNMNVVEYSENVIDVCGTGGDQKNLLNISTSVALVLAGCGVKVAKHGNKAITSKSGSADVLASSFAQSIDKSFVLDSLDKVGLAFLFAPYFHPIMRNIVPIRQKIKERTIFNLIGPLVNPLKPEKQLIGVFNQDSAKKIAEFIAQDSQIKEALVINSVDGMDEFSVFDDTHCYHVKSGEVIYYKINPELFGVKRYDKSQLKFLLGQDSNYNFQQLQNLLSNSNKSGDLNIVYRDMVLLNSALALCLAQNLEFSNNAVSICNKSLESGQAQEILDYFIAHNKNS